MPRFKIIIQYNGCEFSGWQKQKEFRTVQNDIENALSLLNGGPHISVIGAGRTDSGVHARGQAAHFDFKTEMDSCELKNALNGNLNEDVRIMECGVVPEKFHARYSAALRSYLYRCRTDDEILDRNLVWIAGQLDLTVLNEAAKLFLGEHDFTSFSKFNPELKNRQCTVFHSEWSQDSGGIVNYRVSANRFLHHMVRYMAGTMVETSRNNFSLEKIKDLLDNPRHEVNIFRAPAQGLILERVSYDDEN